MLKCGLKNHHYSQKSHSGNISELVMNFSPFGGHFPTSIPTIHQFAAKFTHESMSSTLCPTQDTGTNRYTANGVPSFTQHHPPSQQQHLINSSKYQGGGYLHQNSGYSHQVNVRQDKRQGYDQQELAQELYAAMLQQSQHTIANQHQNKQTNEKIKQERHQEESRVPQPQQQNHQTHQSQPQTSQQQTQNNQTEQTVNTSAMPTTWQSLATPGSTVADYLSHLPASTLPLSLHHFLKYSAESIKKDVTQQQLSVQSADSNLNLLHVNVSSNPLSANGLNTGSLNTNSLTANPNMLTANALTTLNTLTTINTAQIQNGGSVKKKKKKKPEKEKKPRPKPGEIRLTTALDGSTLYCCPECHMAYPEKELLEQHLVGHTLERRFVCDICGAGLKRKDHLTRHKQSHNPERPYVCTVCLKAFKRKEQLTLHFVIHSGEKRHICTECGKGFYRKDHLRKHTRSHIARRVKAELSQQSGTSQGLQVQVAAPVSTSTTTQGILS